MPRKSRKVRRKSKKVRRKTKKCVCKFSCKVCKKKYKSKKCCTNHELKCKKKCANRTKRKYKRVKRKIRKMKQRGCSRQSGGNADSNMGEVFTGYKRNLYNGPGSLIPKTTQSDIPMKMNGGGLFSQRAIDFGLGNALTFLRDGQATFKNIGRTWNGDHHVDSADPVIAGKNFGN